jgi:hypothetical protein
MATMNKVTSSSSLSATVSSVPFTPKPNSVLYLIGCVANDSGYAPANVTDSLGGLWSGDPYAAPNASTVGLWSQVVGAAPAARTVTITATHAGIAFQIYNFVDDLKPNGIGTGAKATRANLNGVSMPLEGEGSTVLSCLACKGSTNPTIHPTQSSPLTLDMSVSLGNGFVAGIAHSAVIPIPITFTSAFVVNNASKQSIAQWEIRNLPPPPYPAGAFWGQKGQ